MSTNIVIYFNDDILQNTSKGVTFICKKPAYFFIPYTMSLADLESGLCRCIEAEAPKTVEKIIYRYPISIFGGFMQYQAILISDDGDFNKCFGYINNIKYKFLLLSCTSILKKLLLMCTIKRTMRRKKLNQAPFQKER